MRRLLILATVLLGLISATSALAAGSPHRYAPKAGAKCRKSYKRVRHNQNVFCVKTNAHPKQTKRPTLRAHLDPAFTRDPHNPFVVTYGFSASASRETGAPHHGARASVAAPLPSGVLSLYSDGVLQCSVEVGATNAAGQCPVTYPALGDHTVTTVYTSGEESATETEVEHVGPLPTRTELEVTFTRFFYRPGLSSKPDVQCTPTGPEEAPQETCKYWESWGLGSITVTGGSDPAGEVQIYCAPNSWCPAVFANLYGFAGWGQQSVDLTAKATVTGNLGSLPQDPTCEQMKAMATSDSSAENIWSYPTGISVRATPVAPGYAPSEAVKNLDFPIVLPC